MNEIFYNLAWKLFHKEVNLMKSSAINIPDIEQIMMAHRSSLEYKTKCGVRLPNPYQSEQYYLWIYHVLQIKLINNMTMNNMLQNKMPINYM